MQVILKPLFHRRQECIGIYFEKNAALQSTVQKEVGAKWSKTYTCWYVTCTGENYLRLKTALENKAELDVTELKKFLLEKRRTGLDKAVILAGNKPKVIPGRKFQEHNSKTSRPQVYLHNISKENKEALQQFKRQLALKAYSQSTIRTYENEFRQFLQAIKNTPADRFSVSRLKKYFQYCYSTLHLSENTMHSRINALKFYYEQTLGQRQILLGNPAAERSI